MNIVIQTNTCNANYSQLMIKLPQNKLRKRTRICDEENDVLIAKRNMYSSDH